MKLAICLFGNLGNHMCAGARPPDTDLMKESDVFINAQVPYDHLQKALSSHYETDFFVHSWAIDHKGFIVKLYNPTLHEIVPQKRFEANLTDYGLIGNDIDKWNISDSSKFGYNALLPSRGSVETILSEMEREIFRTSSRYYSTKKTLELKKQHEEANNFKYDFVLLTRFDIMFYKRIRLENLNKHKFYGNFRYDSIDVDYAISDHWFLGNSEDMDKFSTLFDHRHNYCVRPTFSSRQHIQEFINDEKLEHLLDDGDYGVFRG